MGCGLIGSKIGKGELIIKLKVILEGRKINFKK